jgi:hypothetical protein
LIQSADTRKTPNAKKGQLTSFKAILLKFCAHTNSSLLEVSIGGRKKGRKVKVIIEPAKPINNINSIILYMAATTFLVFYRFKSMNKEEAVKARTEWRELRNGLPDGIELIGEYDHAWGTEYNGFLLIESESSDAFLDWWSGFKDKVRWYVEQTHTIAARRR